MIYIAISKSKDLGESIKLEAGVPLHIKVNSRGMEDQPIIGFRAIEFGEKYLEKKNIPIGDYQFVPIEKGLSEDFVNQPILIIESESQVDEMEKNAEGYDYESHIYKNAL